MRVLLASLLILPAVLAMSTTELRGILEIIRTKKPNFKDLFKTFRTQKKVLACPRPSTFFETERTEPECAFDHECRRDELCCNWFQKKHCLRGLDTTPRHGVCPKITFINDMCIADYVGCQHDSECTGEDEKCCHNTNCDQKQCLSIRQNIACPMPKTIEPSTRSEAKCRKDTNCGEDEKCCEWFSNEYCLKGIDIIPRPGFCPMSVPVALQTCKVDFPSCWHDAECPGAQEKCCYNQGCQYHECIDMNADFTCPTINFADFTNEAGKECSKNEECDGFSSICCDLNGAKKCIPGIHIPPKQGECPAASTLTAGRCTAGNKGECEFDSQCDGEKKCCTTKCGYKQCVAKPAPKPSTQSPPIESNNNNEKEDLLEEIVEELHLQE